MGTTIKQFAEKIGEAKSESFRKLNPKIFGVSGTAENRRRSPNPEGESQSIRAGNREVYDSPTGTKFPEEKLNQLERRWLAVLRTRHDEIGIQNITLRLTNGVRYTPDLNVWISSNCPHRRLTFYETKGPHRFREKGILKLMLASKCYPYFDFVLVEYDKDTGWRETIIAKL